MFEILVSQIGTGSFILGACLGAFVATILYIFATVLDHRRNMRLAKERIWNGFAWDEILIANSYWDQKQCMEIILSEV